MSCTLSGLASVRNTLLAASAIACALLLCAPSCAQFQTPLERLIEHALANNPELAAARANYEAASHKAPQETAWPNPEFSIRYFAEPLQTRAGPQDFAFGVSQSLPWHKRLELGGEAARQRAHALSAEIEQLRLALTAEITERWIEFALIQRLEALVSAKGDSLTALEAVLRARYATGETAHSALIEAQVLLSRVKNERASLRHRRTPLQAALNALLGRPGGTPVPAPQGLEFNPVTTEQGFLWQQLTSHNPMLKAHGFEVAARQAQAKRAELASLPDLAVGFDYIVIDEATGPPVRGGGKDAITASLRFTLPVSRSRFIAEASEAEAAFEAARARLASVRDRLRAELAATLFEIRDARREVSLFEVDLLPKSEESLITLHNAYSGGGVSYAQVNAAERHRLDLEIGLARAVARHEAARNRLEALIGCSLPVQDSGEDA